jgi:hypothetical protein
MNKEEKHMLNKTNIEEIDDKVIWDLDLLGYYPREAVFKAKESPNTETLTKATNALFGRVQELSEAVRNIGNGCWDGLSPDNGGDYSYDAEWVLDVCEGLVGQIPDHNYRGEGTRILQGESTYIIPKDGTRSDAVEEMYWHDKESTRNRGDYSRWRPVSEREDN